ncbi:ribonuclease H-like domain-containing protein [Tanacetum coccineum]
MGFKISGISFSFDIVGMYDFVYCNSSSKVISPKVEKDDFSEVPSFKEMSSVCLYATNMGESVVSNPKIDRDRVIIEDWNSDDEEEVSEVQIVRPETQTVKTRDDKSGQNSKKQGIGFRKVKACFVCKSTDHLIKDYNFHDKKSQEPKLKMWLILVKGRENQYRIIPKGPSVSTVRPSVSTARPSVSTVSPSVKTARPVYATRPIYPRMDNVRPRGSCSPIKRSYYTKPAFIPKDLKQDVKTFGVQNMTTDRTRVVVNTGKVDHHSLKKVAIQRFCYRSWQWWIVVFYSHSTGNKAYITDYEDSMEALCFWNFKLLDESQVVLRAPRKDNVYSLDLKNIVPFGGIKRGFSVARTPQQNGVAERKNRTLIEAARTMLADSLLPIPFWAEAVNTACYVLNMVLVTKPQNKTPYELLIGKSPSISFMRPFGCPLTILNTLDSLGKFDGKSDEGYLLGYSTSRKDKGPTQEYILLPLQPHRTRIPIEDVAPAAHETTSESSPKENDVQDSEDAANKESEQDLQDELEKMVTQELTAKAMDDVTRQAFEEENSRIASQKKAAQAINKAIVNWIGLTTPYVSAASTPQGANGCKMLVNRHLSYLGEKYY